MIGAGSDDSSGFLLGSGVRMDLHQETVETFQIGARTRATQIRITNKQGRIRIMRTLVESMALNIKGGAEA